MKTRAASASGAISGQHLFGVLRAEDAKRESLVAAIQATLATSDRLRKYGFGGKKSFKKKAEKNERVHATKMASRWSPDIYDRQGTGDESRAEQEWKPRGGWG